MSQGLLQVKSSGQEVIMPYQKRKDRRSKVVLLEINSRDRNIRSYPNSSMFRWNLFRPLKDISQITIAGGSLPACMYNLNTGWNAFTFQEGTISRDIIVPPGKYTYDQLQATIATVLNTTSGITNTYSAAFNGITGYFSLTRITGSLPFSFLLGTGNFVDFYENNTLQKINSPAHLLGFYAQDYSDSGTGVITSVYSSDINFLLTRLYLFINHDSSQDISTIERSVGRIQPHAIIYMDSTCNNYKFLNKETYEPLYTAYPAPIARLSSLDIILQDEFGRIIDFNGRDWTLLLEVTYLE